MRIPVASGSLVRGSRWPGPVTAAAVNAAMKEAADGPLKGILVSSDVIGDPHSSSWCRSVDLETGWATNLLRLMQLVRQRVSYVAAAWT